MRPGPELALAKYRRHAAGYDATTARTAHIRRRAIDLLALGDGATVVDVGCGTGLSFPQIEAAIGPRGRLVGVEPSPEMLAIARRRVASAGWTNVMLIEASADRAAMDGPVDAFLFHFTHDVLRSAAALDRLLGRARPGARVAAAGMKYWPWWAGPANLYILLKARPYVATLEGLARPWSRLEDRLSDFQVISALFGSCYVCAGRVSTPPDVSAR